jgi:cytoskeleton protein RodZ
MEQPTENGNVQGESPAPAAAVSAAISLGTTLREARERLGLSITDVVNQTKLAPRQIEALEAEDYRNLPEMAFVRGFVRSYAKILQLDEQPLLAALPKTSAPTQPLMPNSVEAPFPDAYSPRRQNLVWLAIALLLAVLVVAFAVWHFTAPPTKPKETQVEMPDPLPENTRPAPAQPILEAGRVPSADAAAPPLPEAAHPLVAADKPPTSQDVPKIPETKAPETKTPETKTPVTKTSETKPPEVKIPEAKIPEVKTQPVGTLAVLPQNAALRLVFGDESWVEIKDKDDKVLLSQVNPSGSELRMNGQSPFALVIGRAASVRLYYRGKQIDLTPHINAATEVARLTLE